MKTPEEIFGDLFIDMNKSSLWADAKAIADAMPKALPEEILEAYANEKNATDFDLMAFANMYFKFPKAGESGFESDTSKSPEAHIETLWEVLKRSADEPQEGSSLIPLQHPYIVPGGRFNEIYYWDSYFTMLGLQVSKRNDLIEGMVKNFAYLIDEVGFIPNGNRTYFIGRSQPPFFALMVSLLAEQLGDKIYVEYLPYLEKEYAFWMNEQHDLSRNKTALSRVVRVKGDVLNRYWDNFDSPRPEMYTNDLETAEGTDREANQIFRDLRTACESGWDFSSRWLENPMDLSTIHASGILPVDLNCLLYNLEMTLAKANKIAGNTGKRRQYDSKVMIRKNLILEYFWNEEKGFFMDYDFGRKTQKDVFSLAAMYPLFFNIATDEQAEKCAALIKKDFLKAGGVISTTLTTDQQWDAPNGWAPLQWITIQGLRNYGYDDLANEIKTRWITLNTKVYKSTGKMLEKYNVVDIDLATGGGEYPVQDGFGWTNGVLLRLLSE
jgi:alpha,alpha-trehalase